MPIDNAVVNAMEAYLRICSSGGMSKEDGDRVISAVSDAARLGYFSLAMHEHADAMLKCLERNAAARASDDEGGDT